MHARLLIDDVSVCALQRSSLQLREDILYVRFKITIRLVNASPARHVSLFHTYAKFFYIRPINFCSNSQHLIRGNEKLCVNTQSKQAPYLKKGISICPAC